MMAILYCGTIILSSDTTNSKLSRSAFRLRIGVFVTMAALVVLYAAARAGLQLGHARVEYQARGVSPAIAAMVGDIGIVLLVIALFRLTQMLKLIETGELFSVDVVRRFRSFAFWLLVMAVAGLVGPFVGQFVHPVSSGPRTIRLAIDSREILTLGVTLLLFLLARLLERARAIDEEMREIV